ncbi:hypothetical protein NEOKW01_0937 [Nematocida sp. AWRm80]|nr:hypothetical protein NEOKW01_0937 [Nematocida sp. AWRm80]
MKSTKDKLNNSYTYSTQQVANETIVLTNIQLYNYLSEYLREINDELYNLLQNNHIGDSTIIPVYTDISPLNLLVSSLLDNTTETETSESTNTEVHSPQENTPGNIMHYYNLLYLVNRANNKNKARILDKNISNINNVFYDYIIHKIDGYIKILYKKYKNKKKKKEEDINYYNEIEELLNKKNRFKAICKDPKEIEDISIGLEDILETVTKGIYNEENECEAYKRYKELEREELLRILLPLMNKAQFSIDDTEE